MACSLSLIAALGVFVVLSLPAVGSDNNSIAVTAEKNEADIASGIPVKVSAKASGMSDETFFYISLKGDSAALSTLYGDEQIVTVERSDGSVLELTREKIDDGELLSFTLNKSESADFIINTSAIKGIETDKAELKISAMSAEDKDTALSLLTDPETSQMLNLVWNSSDKSGAEILKQQTITADIYTDASKKNLLQDDSTEIKVTGLLPEGARAEVFPIKPDDSELEGKKVLAAFSLNLLNAEKEEIEDIKSAGLTVDINSDKIAPSDSQIDKSSFTVIERSEEASNIIEPSVSTGKLSFTPGDSGEYIVAVAAAGDSTGGSGQNQQGGLPGISIMPLAAGAPVNTVDSRADGIVINLFDYNASDTWSNNIGSVVYANNSINGARSGVRELLFFGYGTTYTQSGGPPINYYTESAAMQGMVRNTLENGFPRLNTTTGSSLDYLFNTSPITNVKTVYSDVNHLFTKDEDGYFEYDSSKNYARYNTSTKNFTVYSNTYLNASGKPVGFFPFNDYNESRTTINPDDNYYNHHFGMTVTASFVMPKNGIVNGKDMVFEFSGDDDFWLFIDDVLVLDIGGIHNPLTGSVNFRTGEVKVGSGSSSSAVAMRNMRTGTSIIGANSTIAQAFAKAGRTFDSSAGSIHTLKLFYLERGGCDSNLKLRLNISSYKSGQLKVMKDITGSNINDYRNREFSAKLYVESNVGSGSYQFYNGPAYYDTGEQVSFTNGVFKFKHGQAVLIDGLDPETRYYVEEIDVDNREFNVLFDGTAVTPVYQNSENRLYTARSPVKTLGDHPVMNITNALIEEFAPLVVNKVWSDGNAGHSADPVTFSLYCNDSLVSYNNQSSFTLNSSNGWQQQFNNLIIRRGLTTYEYTVTENQVDGYVPSYSGSIAGGTITITNTKAEQAPLITLKKQWFNLDGTEKTEGLPATGAEFQLYRRYLNPQEPVVQGHTVKFYIRWVTNSGNQNFQIGEIEVANAGSVTFFHHLWMAPPSVTASGGTLRNTGTGRYNGWLNYPIYTLSNITSNVSVIIDYTSASVWNPGTFNPDGTPQLNDYEFVIQSYTQPVPTAPAPTGEDEWVEELVTTVVLTSATDWEYIWRRGSLPDKAPNGQTYYYYVREVLTEGYSDYYINNDGITEGIITVQNVSLFSYALPDTGGTGTFIFAMAGFLLIITAGFIYGYTKKRDFTERRGKSPSGG